jgi:4-diphosphocytidyl-2C-methyl-D-erythritol kinase
LENLSFRAIRILFNLGTSPSQIHLIGLSVGADLAAYVAKNITGIGRLTGKYIYI